MTQPRIDLGETARQAPEESVQREAEVLRDAPESTGGLVPPDSAQSAPPIE